jgi:hypothetical protein
MEWITTDNVQQEAWRRLLEYTNIEITTDAIVTRHKHLAHEKQKQNIVKQAKQIRVAVLQAKEYFDASASTSLYTSGNHLYYGLASLTTAMMLILGDGTKALDVLRRDPKNGHHGLRFTTSCTAGAAAKGLDILEQTRAEILQNGHFKNWYTTLSPNDLAFAYITTEHKQSQATSSTHRGFYGSSTIATFDEIVGKKHTAASLLRYLPDLHTELDRYGIPVLRSRTTHEVIVKRDNTHLHTWRIHGIAPSADRENFLEKFKFDPRLVEKVIFDAGDGSIGGILRVELPPLLDLKMEWPTCRDTMHHDTISYGEDTSYKEIIEMYLLSFQLSMLARYFPDLWISCIESQCRAAKLIEGCIGVVRRKFPILCLSELSSMGLVISTHREPWKSR